MPLRWFIDDRSFAHRIEAALRMMGYVTPNQAWQEGTKFTKGRWEFPTLKPGEFYVTQNIDDWSASDSYFEFNLEEDPKQPVPKGWMENKQDP